MPFRYFLVFIRLSCLSDSISRSALSFVPASRFPGNQNALPEYNIKKRILPETVMAITSQDILNLSHSLKDICEVNCNTPECLSQTLKILMQYNLIQANLQFGRQFGQICGPPTCPSVPAALKPSRPATLTPSASVPMTCKSPATAAPDISVPPRDDSAPAANGPSSAQPFRLDVGDPFTAD